MKLPVKLAGLCGSGAFIVTAFPAFFVMIHPTDLSTGGADMISGVDLAETLLFSLGGAILAGFIGFQIGAIFAHPANKNKKQKRQKPPPSTAFSAAPVTGDEIFLQDLESYAEASVDAVSAPTPSQVAEE